MSSLVNRNVTAADRRTSMRLEPEVWDALDEICSRERTNVAGLVQRLDRQARVGGRTSAVRVHVLSYFRAAANEQGHAAAGHGALPGEAAHDR